MNSVDLIPQLQTFLTEVDSLIAHLKKQGSPSKADIHLLRDLIFEIDGLLVKLKNDQDAQSNLVIQDVTQTLQDANEHFRSVLLKEEATQFDHPPKNQELNNHLFASLVRQIKNLG